MDNRQLLLSTTVLYCTVLYCTVLYCTVLYWTVLCPAQLSAAPEYYEASFLLQKLFSYHHHILILTICINYRNGLVL